MPLLDVFWTVLIIYAFFIWMMLLFRIFGDIFRSEDLSGWGKTGWSIVVIVLPLLGVFVYLIARGRGMTERSIQDAQAADAATREYIRDAAGSASTADELAKLAELRERGVLSDAEFESQKAALLG